MDRVRIKGKDFLIPVDEIRSFSSSRVPSDQQTLTIRGMWPGELTLPDPDGKLFATLIKKWYEC